MKKWENMEVMRKTQGNKTATKEKNIGKQRKIEKKECY